MLTRVFNILIIIIMLQIQVNQPRALSVQTQGKDISRTGLVELANKHQIVFQGSIESAEKNASGRCKIEIRIEETLKGNFYNRYRLKPSTRESDYKYCKEDYKPQVIVVDRPIKPQDSDDSAIYLFDQESWELLKKTQFKEEKQDEVPWFLSSDFLALIVILCLFGVFSYYIRTSNTVISYNQTKLKKDRVNQDESNISKKKQ
jgi:hypothetical protein